MSALTCDRAIETLNAEGVVVHVTHFSSQLYTNVQALRLPQLFAGESTRIQPKETDTMFNYEAELLSVIDRVEDTLELITGYIHAHQLTY
jgi:hypothetical protein